MTRNVGAATRAWSPQPVFVSQTFLGSYLCLMLMTYLCLMATVDDSFVCELTAGWLMGAGLVVLVKVGVIFQCCSNLKNRDFSILQQPKSQRFFSLEQLQQQCCFLLS